MQLHKNTCILRKVKHCPVSAWTHSSPTHAYNRTHTVGTQESSSETGNDSRWKKLFQREEIYHQVSIVERTEEKRKDMTSNYRKREEALDTIEKAAKSE